MDIIYCKLSPVSQFVEVTGQMSNFFIYDLKLLGDLFPMFFVSFNDTSLYRTFFEIQKMRGIKRISIDTIEEISVWETLADLDFHLDAVIGYKNEQGMHKDKIVSFHKKFFMNKTSDIALTCLRSAYNTLQLDGIPSLRITSTKSAIIDSLEKITLFGESITNKNNHIVVGIASVDQYDKIAAKIGSENMLQRIKLEIQRIFLRFIEEIDGYLITQGTDEYIFVTTLLLFNKVSRSLKIS